MSKIVSNLTDPAVNVTRVTWSLQDDIVYNNPALVLYATGCAWKCKGCYNKELWDFNHPDSKKYKASKLTEYVSSRARYLPVNKITIVGIGGDFWYQLDNWLAFITKVKETHPEIKTVWYTGAELSMRPANDLSSIDSILWGALTSRDGKVYKTITESKTDHSTPGEIFVNEYDSTHEDDTPENTTPETNSEEQQHAQA